ncbi:hypothetical protein J0H33_08135 [bacterium]|nr:hypothetical protein [bacterium]
MLQDPEGLRSEGGRRHQERLVRASVLQLVEAERLGLRHSFADALRRIAQRIDPLAADSPHPHRGPDTPRPAG